MSLPNHVQRTVSTVTRKPCAVAGTVTPLLGSAPASRAPAIVPAPVMPVNASRATLAPAPVSLAVMPAPPARVVPVSLAVAPARSASAMGHARRPAHLESLVPADTVFPTHPERIIALRVAPAQICVLTTASVTKGISAILPFLIPVNHTVFRHASR